ncbi:RNA polymerase sigma factor [Rubrobacter tropicus]|uniref:RNA polymerase sigma factor n=1 Tax=Rubrobacter tropicus TaxID=2653851 RepID=UPI00140D2870|nr:sigma-70 family RNA polymerase sigma factor [Rubrobacter tropicus]
MNERSNDQWLAELRGSRRDEAIADLRRVLVRGLRAGLRGRLGYADPSVEDFAQEALIKILDNLDSFRGDSRFTVWSQKIAVRVAFAEMRRLRWRDVSLEDAVERHVQAEPADALADPEREATCGMLMSQMRRYIDEELTERQRTALLAAMGGMPMEIVAIRMGSNRNAVYKLLHDARKRLKRRMAEDMLSPQDVLAAFAGR